MFNHNFSQAFARHTDTLVSTCVVSILRLESLYVISRATDVTWENPLAAIWSSVEINTGILCSCLPTLRSCVVRFFPKLLGSFRSSHNNSDGDAKQDSNQSGGYGSGAGRGLANSQGSRATGNSNIRKVSADLVRGLTGWGEAMQTSQISCTGGDGHSSDEIHLDDMSPYVRDGGGGIHVTRTVEQDVERLTDESDLESTQSLVGPEGMHNGSASSFPGPLTALPIRSRS